MDTKMIDKGFIVLTKTGLYCAAGEFYLDPQLPVRNALVTHAHADHAVAGSMNVFATSPTILFMQLRYRKQAGKVLHEVKYAHSFQMAEVKVTYFSAGHILGSAMVLMEYKGVRYLYTGDFKLQQDVTVEPTQFVEADVLITETTFAKPQTIHPDPNTEILKLNNLQGANIIIGAYVLGKAQRLSQLISAYCPEKKLRLHYQLLPYHQIYNRFGMDTGIWELMEKRDLKLQRDLIYLVPPMTYNSYLQKREFHMLFATGWDELQSGNEHKLFISDHADWNELMELINRVKPLEIWTLHGEGSYLKEYLLGKTEVRILNK